MNTEEKAKRYDEAVNKLRRFMEQGIDPLITRADVQDFFPELCESEDEKIRKELIEHVKDQQSSFISAPDCRDKYEEEENDKYNSWLAWLEKQGEQKPVSKEYTFKSIPRLLDMIEPTDRAKAYCQKLINILAKEGYNIDAKIVEEVLKGWNGEDVPMAVMEDQKSAWSEEDMKEALRTEYEKGRADTIAEMKSSWSEEDEHLSYWTIHNLTELKNRFGDNYGDSGKCIDWIKQLKQRIGG